MVLIFSFFRTKSTKINPALRALYFNNNIINYYGIFNFFYIYLLKKKINNINKSFELSNKYCKLIFELLEKYKKYYIFICMHAYPTQYILLLKYSLKNDLL